MNNFGSFDLEDLTRTPTSNTTSDSSGSESSESPEATSDDRENADSTEETRSETGSEKPSGQKSVSSSSLKSSDSRSHKSGPKRGSSTVSTASSNQRKQTISITTESSVKSKNQKILEQVRKPVLQRASCINEVSSEAACEEKEIEDNRTISPLDLSNADTTHGIPPMESTANSPLNESSDIYMNFLNDVTDVILGMNMFSASAIDAAIDAILATNLYGDLDKERAKLLVDQLFT